MGLHNDDYSGRCILCHFVSFNAGFTKACKMDFSQRFFRIGGSGWGGFFPEAFRRIYKHGIHEHYERRAADVD